MLWVPHGPLPPEKSGRQLLHAGYRLTRGSAAPSMTAVGQRRMPVAAAAQCASPARALYSTPPPPPRALALAWCRASAGPRSGRTLPPRWVANAVTGGTEAKRKGPAWLLQTLARVELGNGWQEGMVGCRLLFQRRARWRPGLSRRARRCGMFAIGTAAAQAQAPRLL